MGVSVVEVQEATRPVVVRAEAANRLSLRLGFERRETNVDRYTAEPGC